MNPLAWIKSGLDACAAAFNWATGRSALKNSATMQANADAAVREKIAEAAAKDVAAGSDLDQLRKDASES